MTVGVLNSLVAVLSLASILVMIIIDKFMDEDGSRILSKLGHSFLAIAVIILILVFTLKENATQLESMILFTIAVSSGMVMTAKDLTGSPVPKWVSAIHGLIQGGGLAFILVLTYLNQ